MKILIVNTYYSPEVLGGAEVSVKKLAEGYKLAGHQVYVLCSGKSDREEEIDGISVIRMKPTNFTRSLDYEKFSLKKKVFYRWKIYFQRFLDTYNPFNYNRLKAVLSQIKPDIIHTNCLYEITPVIWKVGYDMKIPVIHTLRDYYLICKYSTLKNPRKKEKCNQIGIKCRIRRYIAKKCIDHYVSEVTAPSEATISTFKTNGVLTNKGVCVPNAIDFDIEKVNENCESKIKRIKQNANVTFVYLGTLTEFKGVRWLVESVMNSDKQNIHLIIAGKGPLEEYIKKICEMDSRIEFKGFLKEKDVEELLKKCDVLICPSLWPEPFGRVVLDSYKAGMPVISSDQGALKEIVEDKKTGIVVHSEYKEKLQAEIERIAENKNILAEYITNIPLVLQKYSIDNQLNNFMKIYEEFMK